MLEAHEDHQKQTVSTSEDLDSPTSKPENVHETAMPKRFPETGSWLYLLNIFTTTLAKGLYSH